MLKKLLLVSIIATNLNCMQKLVLRCSQKQMIKITKALSSELFGPTIKSILTNSTSSIIADKDRKHYTLTFDLDCESADKQKENLSDILNTITKDEVIDYSSCCHPSDFSGS
jgi:hypothetical protein